MLFVVFVVFVVLVVCVVLVVFDVFVVVVVVVVFVCVSGPPSANPPRIGRRGQSGAGPVPD